jgi:hypothetical protein
MPRRALILAVLAATAVAGCGSSHGPAPSLPKVQPGPDGNLRVTPTDGRVGDASVADARGTRQLKVPARIVDPAQLKARKHQGVGAGDSCTDVDLDPTADNMGTIIASTLCLLNGQRADAGLPPLSSNDRLAQAAVEHSQDMVAKQYFDHQAPDGRDVVDRVRATGYIPDDRRWTVGENLAWGTGTLATPRNIVAAWMNSQGHRENILRPEFREIGFGVVTGNPRSADGSGATYTTNFGAVSGGSEASTTTQVASTTTSGAKARKATRKHRRAASKARSARVRKRCARRARNHFARASKVRKARRACVRRAQRAARRHR